jgi:3-phosphoglycerate kinase
MNDAFGTAHRAHASTRLLHFLRNKKCFRLLLAKEIEFK